VYSSPAVVNGVVYVGSRDHNVYALNASTGAKLWSYATGNWVESSPAVAKGVVHVGSDDGNVYALDASTGAKLWSYTTGDWVEPSPAVANGVVYIGSARRKRLRLRPEVREGREEARAASKCGLKMLHPDFNLELFEPFATVLALRTYRGYSDAGSSSSSGCL
jgi:hypothetical protein